MRFGIYGCRHAHIAEFVDDMLKLGHEFVGIYETEPDIAKGMAEKYKVPLFDIGIEVDHELCKKIGGKVRVLIVGPAFADDFHLYAYSRCRDIAEVVAITGRNEGANGQAQDAKNLPCSVLSEISTFELFTSSVLCDTLIK